MNINDNTISNETIDTINKEFATMNENKEQQKSTRGGKREGAGRKPSLPTGTKTRCLRCTEEEYEKIKIFVRKLREKQDLFIKNQNKPFKK